MSDQATAYQKDGVNYLAKIIELFGGYKRRSFEFLRVAPGMAVLDVGCGSGEDALALAAALGPNSKVVGVDSSDQMLAAANHKKAGTPLPVSFQKADAAALPFDDGTFDRVRADRVFQHLADPAPALGEMIRATKAGGWVSVCDIDWDSLLIDSARPDLTRAVLQVQRRAAARPTVGRELYGLFKRSGLAEVEAYAETVCVRDLPIAAMIWGLDVAAKKAAEAGVIALSDAQAWLGDLAAKNERGEFFASITGFVARGRKG